MSSDQKPDRENTNAREVNAGLRPGHRRRMLDPEGAAQKRCHKNDDQSHYVYENKLLMDKLPGEMSDIYVDMTRVLQKTPAL